MRILILSRMMPWHEAAGGLETHAEELWVELEDLGHEVTVITTRLPSETRHALDGLVEVDAPFDPETRPWRNRWEWWPHAAREAAEELQRETGDFDAVIAEQYAGWALFNENRKGFGVRISVLHGTTYLDYLHTTQATRHRLGWLMWAWQRYTARRDASRMASSDVIVTVSDYNQALLREHHGIESVVIANGVRPLPQPAKPDSAPEPGFPLYLGRVVNGKGVSNIPGGAVVAGRVEDAGLLPANCVSLGYVSDAEKRWLFENCGRFIHPSRYEGDSITIREALYYGAQVVADPRWLPDDPQRTWRDVARDYESLIQRGQETTRT